MQGDKGSLPDQGTKILYVAEQLSPHATTTAPERHNERLCATTTAPVRHNERHNERLNATTTGPMRHIECLSATMSACAPQ